MIDVQSFRLASDYEPRGDQPEAIAQLVRGIEGGEKHQVLLGVTGSGKTFTMAKIIEQVNRPALVLAHNKTLAAQLFNEFRNFFPQNAVEYFVSYYDYYQPEAYMPASDTYIEKESTINDELDRLRMSATRSLFERRDVVIVASVSCIYGLGSPEAYYGMLVMLEPGQQHLARGAAAPPRGDSVRARRGSAARHLPRARRHDRNSSALRGPRLSHRDVGRPDRRACAPSTPSPAKFAASRCSRLPIYPKSHYVMPAEQKERAIRTILEELALVEAGAREAGQIRRGAARVAAHHVRHRDDAHHRLLPRHRELFAAHVRPASRAKRRPRCSITCRRIICCSSTNRTRPFRRYAGCITATARASRRWWTTVFACPRRWIIGRSISRSSSIAPTKWSTFPPRPGHTS